jgi:hypothetical protein
MREQHGVAGRILGGWQLSGVTAFETGVPVNITNGADADGIDGSSDRPNYNPNGKPGVRAVPDALSATGYVNPDANRAPINPADAMYIALPAFSGTERRPTGNLGRNTYRMPGINNFDVTLLKRIAITERFKLQLGVETYNIFNHPQFGSVSKSPFAPQVEQGMAAAVSTAPAGRFLRPEFADGGARMMRYNLKLTF